MNIKPNEWNVLKIYLANTRQETIYNLRVAYEYFKTREQDVIFLRLLDIVETMDDSEFSLYVEHMRPF